MINSDHLLPMNIDSFDKRLKSRFRVQTLNSYHSLLHASMGPTAHANSDVFKETIYITSRLHVSDLENTGHSNLI